MTIYLTHGAKKNVGDYLIHSRARELCTRLLPGSGFVSIPRWDKEQPLDEAEALVLCGGPGLTPRFIESVFPVAQSAMDRGIPVSCLALGWQGLPKRSPGAFRMTARSVAALRRLSSPENPISVRDETTRQVADYFGFDTVVTGCTAWYSIPHLGQKPSAHDTQPQTIVYTTPALSEHTRESIAVMRFLRRRFPRSRLIASFHRGIKPDALTPRAQSRRLMVQAAAARLLGFEVRDVSYDLSKIGFYSEVDLHVGYRVHAHLDFVSRRMPSLLISEDGRGFGQTVTLHGKQAVIWAGDSELVEKLDTRLTRELERGWPSLMRAVETIERSYPVMEEAIRRACRSGISGDSLR